MAFEFPNIDPVAISLGPFDIRWYAIAYLAGFLLGWKYAVVLYKRYFYVDHGADQDKEDTQKDTSGLMDDFLTWIILGVIIGGRLGYVLFYQLDAYIDNPVAIFKIWQGGMSFHGGFVGAVLSAFFFSKKRNVSFLMLTDILACVAPIGLFFGRMANFINGELYGRVTTVDWGIVFPGAGALARHPSQLYEALLEGLVIFAVMFVLIKRDYITRYSGFLSGLFVALYGLFRAFVEFYREPDPQIGYIFDVITMGQILCLPMIALGAWLMFWSVKAKKS